MAPNLMAGAAYAPVTLGQAERPTILTFDSGLGGLTVLAETMRRLPDARHIYLADDAAFPYGALPERELIERVVAVLDRAIERYRPHIVVIACHTASTLALPVLRDRFAFPFVGTVPAIKLGVRTSAACAFAVLATPGTIARDYTRHLVETYARGCQVTLVASARLATLAEQSLKGEPVDDASLAAEIAPCFVETRRPIDTVVLACTHYPLLRERLARLAPWPVEWVDPAPAVARRVADLLPQTAAAHPPCSHRAVFTSGAGVTPALVAALGSRGLTELGIDAQPRLQLV